MAFVYYFPMVHVDCLDSGLDLEIKSALERVHPALRQDQEFIEGLRTELKRDYPQINECWYQFLDFLKEENKQGRRFNKVYLESQTERKQNCNLIKTGTGMTDCIDYMLSTGAVFEQAESEFINNLTWKFRNNKLLSGQLNKLREAYLGHRIDSTLEHSDRALLLYGVSHGKNIANLLSYYQIQFEVHKDLSWPEVYLN